MAKFSKKNLEKYINKNIYKITQGYLAHGGKKDKRSADMTVADAKRARDAFIRDVEGRIKADDQLTTTQAANRSLRSQRFNIYSDISRENMQKKLKEFGYNVRNSSLSYDKDAGTFKVTAGQYKGKFVRIVHQPGSYPSYVIELA